MGDGDATSDLIELLAWYAEMGVEAIVANTPTAWLERGDRAAAPPAARSRESTKTVPPPAAVSAPVAPVALERRFPGATPDVAVMAARAAARQATDLDQLAASLARFDGCSLKATATNLCFYRGMAQAAVMAIGEAPGREEDLAGSPFVGPAGQLLDKMLAAIGLSERTVHITNIVYWRPPGNRTPTPEEAQVCHPFLERQVALVAPELLVLLGGAAAKHLLGATEGIMRLRGTLRVVSIAGRRIPAVATLHPAYLLRTPSAKRLAWRDLLLVKATLAGQRRA
jgi:DNA polymerase